MTRAESFIEYLRRFTGVIYRSTGTGMPSAGDDDPIMGFSCSGLIVEGLRRDGIVTDRPDVWQLFTRFRGLTVWERPADGHMKVPEFRVGDLLFYGTGLDNVNHVSAVADAWHIIEAGGGGKGTDTIIEAASLNAFVRERPLAWRGAELQAVVRIYTEEAK